MQYKAPARSATRIRIGAGVGRTPTVRTSARRKGASAIAALIGTVLLVLSSTIAAQAATPSGTPAPAGSSSVVEAPMSFDCSTFTEADRQKAISLHEDFCGALESAPQQTVYENPIRLMGQHTSNCGTAAIYVDRVNGRVRISYGMHSTAGPILTRSVTATWGPTVPGTNYDFGYVASEDYSNHITAGAIAARKKEGATLGGSVTIAGWAAVCTVSADDAPHGM